MERGSASCERPTPAMAAGLLPCKSKVKETYTVFLGGKIPGNVPETAGIVPAGADRSRRAWERRGESTFPWLAGTFPPAGNDAGAGGGVPTDTATQNAPARPRATIPSRWDRPHGLVGALPPAPDRSHQVSARIPARRERSGSWPKQSRGGGNVAATWSHRSRLIRIDPTTFGEIP